ncbi:MAG: hypothetical protein ACR2KU_03815 [Gammaproteobacteria bacterium]
MSLLTPFSVIASNTIGNAPVVVMLLQALENIPADVLTALAVFTTLSGNLLLTGSLANIIVVERAAAHGVPGASANCEDWNSHNNAFDRGGCAMVLRQRLSAVIDGTKTA